MNPFQQFLFTGFFRQLDGPLIRLDDAVSPLTHQVGTSDVSPSSGFFLPGTHIPIDACTPAEHVQGIYIEVSVQIKLPYLVVYICPGKGVDFPFRTFQPFEVKLYGLFFLLAPGTTVCPPQLGIQLFAVGFGGSRSASVPTDKQK